MKRDYRLRLTQTEHNLIQQRRSSDSVNVLCIGDLHEPFCFEGYREHCYNTYHKYNCNTVVFIGDLIDLHYSSFHTADPDGYGAGNELERAINKIKLWYDLFPVAKVCIGNHDAIVRRKAFEAGISKKWVRDFDEVLGVPNWEFREVHKIGNVIYTHGTGTSGRSAAVNKSLQFQDNTVQGHIHTESSIIWEGKNWGMQVGCGVNRESYAMAYAKFFPKTYKLACGGILDNGKQPIIIPLTTLSKQ